jgi:hypothetical protein
MDGKAVSTLIPGAMNLRAAAGIMDEVTAICRLVRFE